MVPVTAEIVVGLRKILIELIQDLELEVAEAQTQASKADPLARAAWALLAVDRGDRAERVAALLRHLPLTEEERDRDRKARGQLGGMFGSLFPFAPEPGDGED